MTDYSKLYWERGGELQAQYDEMEAAEWKFTKASEGVFHSYYRYFNDGDFPGWARGDWSLRRYGRWGWELNEKGMQMQEQRVTDAILREYARYQKATRKTA